MTRANKRRKEELRLAKVQGWITTRNLAPRFHVTQSTILKDLSALAKAGLLQKTGFGSAAIYVPTHPPDADPPAKTA